MNDELKAFGDLAKADSGLAAAIRAAVEAGDIRKLVELANQRGIELSEDDFGPIDMADVDDEELDAVAGGKTGACKNKTDSIVCGLLFYIW